MSSGPTGPIRGLSRVFSRQRREEAERGPSGSQGGDGEPALLATLWRTGAWRILPFLAISILGLAVLIPILPVIMTEFFAMRRDGTGEPVNCASYTHSREPKPCQDAHSDSVFFSSATSFVSQTIVSFLLTPLVGRLSDQYGRRPVLILSAVLSTAPVLVFILYQRGLISLLWWYPAIVGTTGVDKISISVAYTADLMPPSLRATTIGLVTASLAGALFVGPFISAWVPPEHVAWLLVVLGALSILWVIFLIPESVTFDAMSAARVEAEAARAGSDSVIRRFGQNIFSTWSIVLRSRLFLSLTFVMMAAGVVQEGLQDLILQYLQLKVNFGVKENAALLQFIGVGGLITQTLLLRPLLTILGEKWVLVVALVFQAAQQVLLALADTKAGVWTALTFGVVGMMSYPTLSAIKSNNSAEHEQGAVQGALYGAKALAQGTGPLMFAPLFAAFTRSDSPLPYFPGAPFLFGACLMVVAIATAVSLPSDAASNKSPIKLPGSPTDEDLESPLLGGSVEDVCTSPPVLESYYGKGGMRGQEPGSDMSGGALPPSSSSPAHLRSPHKVRTDMPSIGEDTM